MSTALVSALMLSDRHVLSRELLIAKYDWLIKQIEDRGGRVDRHEGATTTIIVDHALRLLKDCVEIRRNVITPLITQRKDYRNLLQLGYYGNQLTYLFFAEGIICCSLASFQDNQNGIPIPSVIEEAKFLRKLLNLEFYDCPSSHEVPDYGEVISLMHHRNLLEIENGKVKINSADGERTSQFITGLYYPFIDSYWVACLTLISLQPSQSITERILVDRIQWCAEKLHFDQVLIYFESCSKDTLANAVSQFIQWGVLEKVGGISEVKLTEKYKTGKALEELARKINKFRKTQRDTKLTVEQQLMKDFPILSRL